MTDLTYSGLVERVLAVIDPHAKARDALGYTTGGEEYARKVARAAIATIREALNEPTEAMWSGLARKIFLAWDLGAKTPRQLFEQLEMMSEEIPRWLRDEPEMQALDHVPSKGTRAVIIFRAMLLASPLYEEGK